MKSYKIVGTIISVFRDPILLFPLQKKYEMFLEKTPPLNKK